MTPFFRYSQNGQVHGRSTCLPGQLPEIEEHAAGFSLSVAVGTPPPVPCWVTFEGNTPTFHELPARPSQHHDFNYTTKQWEPNTERAWSFLRAERASRLSASDWIVVKSTEAGVPVPPAWVAYRQALRDITEAGDPLAVVWPALPI